MTDLGILSALHMCVQLETISGEDLSDACIFLKRKLLYYYLGAGKIVCVLCFKYIYKYINSILYEGVQEPIM